MIKKNKYLFECLMRFLYSQKIDDQHIHDRKKTSHTVQKKRTIFLFSENNMKNIPYITSINGITINKM